MIEPRGSEGRGFESRLLKMGIEGGGSFNVLVSKNSRNSDVNFYEYLKPRCASVYCPEARRVECQCQFICFFCSILPSFPTISFISLLRIAFNIMVYRFVRRGSIL